MSWRAVTSPNRAKKKINIGISNTSARPSNIFVIIEK